MIKLKYVSGYTVFGLVLVFIAAFMFSLVPLTASAAAAQTIELRASGSEAQLIMNFPQAAAEEIASMQISLQFSGISEASGANIEFIHDSKLPAKIVEPIYHSDTGILNIYLAGNEALFDAKSSLTVGTVRLSGSNVSASVNVVEGSIYFVRGGELVSPSDVKYPQSVTITTVSYTPDPTPPSTGGNRPPSGSNTRPPSGGDTRPPSSSSTTTSTSSSTTTSTTSSTTTSTSSSTTTSSTSSTTTSTSSSTTTSTSSSTTTSSTSSTTTSSSSSTTTSTTSNTTTSSSSTAPEQSVPTPDESDNGKDVDTSSLLSALSKANSYKRGDYTESSYSALIEAVNKAQTVLSDKNAAQNDIDDALLALENSIAMLVLRNETPSEIDGNSSSGGNSSNDSGNMDSNSIPNSDDSSGSSDFIVSSNDSSNSGGVSSVSGGQSASDDSSGSTVSSESSQSELNENISNNNTVIWIIVIMAALIVVAITIGVAMKRNNGK